MKKGGFVEAVTAAISFNSDNWEIEYYKGCDRFEWDKRKLEVYMHTRCSARGPEFREFNRCCLMARGNIPYADYVRPY